ncbi:hypothetical protein Rumal_0957 [Ruminococcus albus 7 = DSM 20455]|uniref:Uncharacterized protein n=1 Tax=Ruminococcus albus (strain ATCC 27210 / DSM 20455 / JCM 14654 / NCDO 2250 / 7) TaxID=697329 RepID=E6UBD3_RUMA7|nr:hypothetical protein Rumal_0957 [Ruminococcus albus 7 = DSM 20455]
MIINIKTLPIMPGSVFFIVVFTAYNLIFLLQNSAKQDREAPVGLAALP